jgi:phytoene dehydrogenase-like protein
VVLDVRHEPLDPTRPLTPRGADLETEDEVYATNPQLSAILATRFTAAIIGYHDGASIRAGLPSLPPDLHAFVFLGDDGDLTAFGSDFGWLRLLLEERSPTSDTAIANLLRQAAHSSADSRRFLLGSGKALATELSGEPLRMRSLLRELGG